MPFNPFKKQLTEEEKYWKGKSSTWVPPEYAANTSTPSRHDSFHGWASGTTDTFAKDYYSSYYAKEATRDDYLQEITRLTELVEQLEAKEAQENARECPRCEQMTSQWSEDDYICDQCRGF